MMSRTISSQIVLTLLTVYGSANQDAVGAELKGMAVVELFSSEGCSSCPPADKVLAKLVAEQAKSKTAVYCLTFHVDYWDKLGWPDRFADHRFTERQSHYAQALDLNRVYTPQMIVNGQTEFVGSNAKTATRAIAAALQAPAQFSVTLSAKCMEKGKVTVQYNVNGPGDNAVLQIAVVETNLKTAVKRGENAGETLAHANVVRAWETFNLQSQASDTVSLVLPPDMVLAHSRVIAFVQHPVTKQVLGANQSDTLEPRNSSRR